MEDHIIKIQEIIISIVAVVFSKIYTSQIKVINIEILNIKKAKNQSILLKASKFRICQIQLKTQAQTTNNICSTDNDFKISIFQKSIGKLHKITKEKTLRLRK